MQHHLPARQSGGSALDRTPRALHGAEPSSAGLRRHAAATEAMAPDARAWGVLFGEPALSAAEQQALSAVARMRVVPAGDDVFNHLEPARSLVALRSGDVALGYRTSDGVFHVERPVRGTAWLDQSSAWLEERHAMDARAGTDAVVIELPRDDLQLQAGQHPQLALRLVACLAREVQSLAVNTHELMHKDAPARFAAWLVQRCEPVDPAAQRVAVRLTERKRDIASQLAITPETLSRLMRSLSRQGLIAVAGYSVQVLDLPALRQVAHGA